MKLLLNFLPIILIFLLVTYTPEMAQISHTVLGKLVAVSVILLYTKIDILSGLLVTALIILYYQSDYVESFQSIKEQFTNAEREPFVEVMNKESNIPADMSFELLTNAYKDDTHEKVLLNPDAKLFRQVNCSKGHLIHKGQIIQPEVSEHIFPEIKQNDFHKCNICDHNCKFDFIDKQIKTEDILIKSKSAKSNT